MSEEHQLLYKLKDICKSHGINQGKAILAFELYVELCEVYKLWEVEYHFHEKLNIFYFTGKLNDKDKSCNTYVPVTVDETLSLKYIEELQKNLSPTDESLIIVFKDRDSSSTHYRITQGLKRPDSPTTAQKKKIDEKNSVQYTKFLIKSRKKLYAKALENDRDQSTF